MEEKRYNFWFIIGSQFLYGTDTLNQVEKNAETIINSLNKSGTLPCKIIYKSIIKTSSEAVNLIKDANNDLECAGIITFCHTFSPSKMWINGLKYLQKPWLHFHTQFLDSIPNEVIDMDYMNLHQSAHGDREHAYIGARMGKSRKIVFGHWADVNVQKKIAKWMRAAVGFMFSQSLKVMRFGDNMREVAVTEGDKVEAQIKFGWEVNTWPVGLLVETMKLVSEKEVNRKLSEYRERYNIITDDMDSIQYQALEEVAMRKLLKKEDCMAFTNTFEDLYGMNQLPGLATQNMMLDGYGYGGEGDWKTSALTSIIKAMTVGLDGGTSFMEDYTYDFQKELILGSHMLEVCPSIASNKANIEVHPLGIGNRQPPARLKFEGKAGPAIVTSLIDLGDRFRLIVQDIECVKPPLNMPNLPVARVMWKTKPDFYEGVRCWLLAGGAHHTVLSYDCDAEMMQDWARMFDVEFVHIGKNTTFDSLEERLLVKR